VTTTRAPVAAARHRIAGLFALRAARLAHFAALPPSHTEMAECCDINRLIDARVAVAQVVSERRPYVSVDRPGDIAKVEAALAAQPWRNPKAAPGAYAHYVI
jgi:CMP-2-keto-3-deoxyoctulosonic acid synthetase